METIEIFKDIPSYKGYYQISNFGNLRSLERYILVSKKGKRKLKCKILKFNLNKLGYYYKNLNKDGEINF